VATAGLKVGVLEDVAAGARSQGHENRLVVFEERYHKDSDVWAFLQDPRRGLYAVYFGHLQVHQDHVGLELGCASDGLLTGCRFADDLELGDGLEMRDHALPVERVVFGDEDAQRLQVRYPLVNGTRTRTRVPPSGTDWTTQLPPSSEARSRIEERTTPALRPAGMPTPSSTTSSVTAWFTESRTAQLFAFA
jgi:hypothetical protein